MPREKMILYGVESLTDAELLAIMLSSGTKNENVFSMSERLIKEYGIRKIFSMSYNELKNIDGIKEAKATKLMASFEIARRAEKEVKKDCLLTDSLKVYQFVKGEYRLLDYELLTIIFVDVKCNFLIKKSYSEKKVTEVELPIREIVKTALDVKAFGIYVIHNHPSGDIIPSKNDIKATRSLMSILEALSLHLFDSIIIGNNNYFSLFDSTNEKNI